LGIISQVLGCKSLGGTVPAPSVSRKVARAARNVLPRRTGPFQARERISSADDICGDSGWSMSPGQIWGASTSPSHYSGSARGRFRPYGRWFPRYAPRSPGARRPPKSSARLAYRSGRCRCASEETRLRATASGCATASGRWFAWLLRIHSSCREVSSGGKDAGNMIRSADTPSCLIEFRVLAAAAIDLAGGGF